MAWTFLDLLQILYFRARNRYSKYSLESFPWNCVFKVGYPKFWNTAQSILNFDTGLRDTIHEDLDKGFFFDEQNLLSLQTTDLPKIIFLKFFFHPNFGLCS